MKKTIYFTNKLIIWAIFLATMFSCTGKNEYYRIMERADSIMDINDDSAIIAINMLNKYKSKLPEFTTSQRMQYQLLYHKAMNKAYIDFTSDSIMREVANYYEKHGTANNRMLAYYILGCVYRDMHEVPMALEYYNKATEQADTTSTDCDYTTLCRVFSQMSFLFAKQHLPYQELSSLGKAVKYAYQAKDTFNAISYYQNQQSAYVTLNKIDSAIYINTKASELFHKYGYNRDADIAYGCNYTYFLQKKEFSKAKQAYEAFARTNYKGNANYKDSYAFLLYEKGLLYLNIGKEDSAHILFQQCLKLSPSYNNKADATKGLALYYSKTSRHDLAAKYALLSATYNDSDLIDARKTQMYQMQAMYDYNRNKDLAIKAEQKSKKRLIEIYGISSISLLLILALTLSYRNRILKRNRKLAICQQLYCNSLQQLRLAKEELEKLHHLDKQKIDNLIKEKEMMIQTLQIKISQYEEENIGHNIVELERQIKQTSIYLKFAYLENHPKETVSKTDWINLETTIEDLVFGFSNLKHKVNTKEYHICLLVKLNFSPSTISRFIGTSLADISLSRQRMLAKVCGKTGKAKEFDAYIHSIL